MWKESSKTGSYIPDDLGPKLVTFGLVVKSDVIPFCGGHEVLEDPVCPSSAIRFFFFVDCRPAVTQHFSSLLTHFGIRSHTFLAHLLRSHTS